MKRQLKFRAWDKLQKKMILPPVFSDLIVIQLGRVVGLFNEKTYDTATDEFEIMQWTETLDNEGNEIYEGDIIKSDYANGFTGVVVYEQQAAAWWIKWTDAENKNRYHELTRSELFGDGEQIRCNSHHVVGNIYETAKPFNF